MTPWSAGDLLPALLVALAAGGLTVLLARAYDRVPGAVLGVFALVVALAFGRVLADGEVLLPLDGLRAGAPFLGLPPTDPPGNPLQGDLLQLVAPAQAEVRRALGEGRWPFWSPRMGAGMPLLADPQAQALQPLALLGLVLPVPQAAGVTAALRVYLALLFTYLFLRRLGLGVPAALTGALAWGLGGFLSLWLGWPLANTAAWLPALLYALARVADRAGRRDGMLLAAAGWGLALAGHPETQLYAGALGVAFFAARLGGRREPGAPTRGRALAVGSGALTVALGAAAPALLPAASYLPQTLRATNLAGPPPEPAAPTAGRRAALRLVPLAAPNAFGNDRYHAYWGADNVNEDASGFVGTAALVLVVAGLFRRRGRKPQEGLWLAAAGVCLLVVAQTPGVLGLLRAVPGGTVSGHHHRLLLPLGFCLAVLAACELDRRAGGGNGSGGLAADAAPSPRTAETRNGVPAARGLSRRSSRLRGDEGPWWPLLVAAAALAAFHAWAYSSFRHPGDPGALEVLRWGSLLWHLRTAAAVLVLLLLARRWRRAAWGVPAVAAVELLVLLGPANPPAPKRLAFPETPSLAFVRERIGDARIAGVGEALRPNLAALWGLADARLYSPMAPAAYAAATRPITLRWSGEVPEFGRPDHPLYDLLGVRHVLAPPDAELPSPLAKVFDHPSGAVWERPRPLPRLFLPSTAVPMAADWPAQLAAVSDFAALALVAELPPDARDSGAQGGVWAASEPAAGVLVLESDAPAHLRAAHEAPEPRLLATSVYQDGGWRLLIDGRRHPTTLTNGPFVGAWLTAGRHRLDLLYRPGPFLAGCLLAALAVTAALAWWLPRDHDPSLLGPPPDRVLPAPRLALRGSSDTDHAG